MEKIYPYLDIIFLSLIILFLLFFFIRMIGKKVGLQKSNTLEVANIISNIKNVKPGTQVKENTVNNKEVIAEGSLNAKIHKLKSLDPKFEIKSFLNYSKEIFSKIVINYNLGNIDEIKDLLTNEMYTFFKNYLNENTINNKVLINKFMMLDIVDIEFEEDIVKAKVKYITKQTINEITTEFREYWLLSKNLKSEDSSWKLCKVLNA